MTENSDALSKNLKSESKNKLRCRRNVIEKSQGESKKFDAIDVGLYHVRDKRIKFHKVVYRHYSGEVGNIYMILQRIY